MQYLRVLGFPIKLTVSNALRVIDPLFPMVTINYQQRQLKEHENLSEYTFLFELVFNMNESGYCVKQSLTTCREMGLVYLHNQISCTKSLRLSTLFPGLSNAIYSR